jgi:hypothetical protein
MLSRRKFVKQMAGERLGFSPAANRGVRQRWRSEKPVDKSTKRAQTNALSV